MISKSRPKRIRGRRQAKILDTRESHIGDANMDVVSLKKLVGCLCVKAFFPGRTSYVLPRFFAFFT